MKMAKKTLTSGDLLYENCRNVFLKAASTLDVAMVTKGGQRRLKNYFVLKITSFKLSESFQSVPLAVLEEVYLGGGGGGGRAMCPPPPPHLRLALACAFFFLCLSCFP